MAAADRPPVPARAQRQPVDPPARSVRPQARQSRTGLHGHRPRHRFTAGARPQRLSCQGRSRTHPHDARRLGEVRVPLLRRRRSAPGHRARRVAGDGPGAAGTDLGLRRQPHLHRGRRRHARLGHRLDGRGARARDPDAAAGEARLDAGPLRRAHRRRRLGQGPRAVPDRQAGCERRHRLRRRVRRCRDRRHAGRGAPDAVQHGDRVFGEIRLRAARRQDLRLPARPRILAEGRRLGRGGRLLAAAAHRSRRPVRARGRHRLRRHRAAGDLGHQPAAGDRRRRRRPGPRCDRRCHRARRHEAGAALHEADAGNRHRQHRHRRRVYRLVHQCAHLRSARGRRGAARPQGRTRSQGAVRARLHAGEGAGGSGRVGQGVQGRRFRVA